MALTVYKPPGRKQVRQPLQPPGPSMSAGPKPAMAATPASTLPQPGQPMPTAASTEVGPAPEDPNAAARRALLTNIYDQTNQNLDYQTGTVKREYGFDDPSDPFNRQAMLRQSYENRQRGTTNSYAARGQLYSGALENAKAQDTRNYDVGYDQLRKGQDAALGEIGRRRTAATNAYQGGTIDANAAELQAALANRPDPTALPVVDPGQQPNQPKLTDAQQRRKRRQALGISLKTHRSARDARSLRGQGLL